MKLTKEMILSLVLLAFVIIVPYALTNIFGREQKVIIAIQENFKGQQGAPIVYEHIRGITGGGPTIPGGQKKPSVMEVKGVYENDDGYTDVNGSCNDGHPPNSSSSPVNVNLSIPTPSEKTVPLPSSAERLPRANIWISMPDDGSVETALAPEITEPSGIADVLPTDGAGPSYA
jgi:hypothetical protein